jgi:hypothetical protein
VNAYCDPWRKFDVYASVRAFEQFERVFGANSPRLVKLIAGQVGYHWPGYNYNHMVKGDLACLNNATINPNHTTINAYAMAPYMGGQSMAAQKNQIDTQAQYMNWTKNSLDSTGISLICYEGGADNYPDNGLTLSNDTQQVQIYIDYLNALAPICSGVFNQYCFYGGCWGLKNHPGEATDSAPKWRGWMSYWANPSTGIVGKGPEADQGMALSSEKFLAYPNPVSGKVLTLDHLSCPGSGGSGESALKVTISDLNGRELLNTTLGSKGAIDLAGFKKGIYLLKLDSGNGQFFKKLAVE